MACVSLFLFSLFLKKIFTFALPSLLDASSKTTFSVLIFIGGKLYNA